MDPWHVVAVLATAIVTGLGILFRAFLRGDVVAGSTYRLALKTANDERKARQLAERRADKADIQVDRNTDAVRELTASVKTPRERSGTPDG